MSEQETNVVTPSSPERLPEWPQIAEEGGMQGWVEQELRRRDLIDTVTDTSKLSAKERKQYKARREEERRVRRHLKKHAWAAFKRSNLVHLGRDVFYHDTVDVDRFDVDDPPQRLLDNELPPLKNVQELANILDLSIGRLRFLSFHREVDTGTNYHRWTVPKRDGGKRLISAPKPDLKAAQKWIANKITEHLPVHGAAHGFLTGRSTVSNAVVHAGAKAVLKLDLKDFYPSINWKRVKGIFRKAGYNEQVATVLALLCTESPREELELRGRAHYVALGPRSLPQGAPTSPSITNTLCLKLDARMTGLATTLGFCYSRYADDMTFSWHQKTKAPIGPLLRGVNKIVYAEGFRINREKTRLMRAGQRQKITGLVVNQADPDKPKARVPRKVVRQLRAAIRNRELGKEGKGESLMQLKGLAAYIYMTDRKRGRDFLERLNKLAAADAATKTAAQEDGETT